MLERIARKSFGSFRSETSSWQYCLNSGLPSGGALGVQTPPPPEILKALQNRAKLNLIWKLLKIAEFRMPTPQDVRKKRQ